LLKHADRVSVACQAQLVNVIAPILTQPGGPAWAQTIFHPFALTARYAGQQVLRVEPIAATYDTARHADVPVVDATATLDADGAIALFAVNRSPEPTPLRVDIGALSQCSVVKHSAVYDADVNARNTAEDPHRVRPRELAGAGVQDGVLAAMLPPVSWNLIRLTPAPAV
jgi:alpha-N-arabinofuranosidase